MQIYFYVAILIIILYFIDGKKTIQGVKIGFKKLKKNAHVFLNMMVIVSVSLSLVSKEMISKGLSADNGLVGALFALVLGSLTLMPGFIAFPLAGVLVERGINYWVISLFTTSLMLVGILTYPVEKQYFGRKITIIRNLVGVVISIIISLVVGILYGELIG